MTIFAERLEIAMHEYRYNKNQLANRLGVSAATVSRWFSRGSMPGVDTIEQIANIFNVDQRWLVGSIDEMRPQKQESKKEDESDIDDELVRTLRSLTPAQLQRVKDFVSGLKG